MRMVVRIEHWREALARKLIKLAIAIDPGNSVLCEAYSYKLEIGWKHPKLPGATQEIHETH